MKKRVEKVRKEGTQEELLKEVILKLGLEIKLSLDLNHQNLENILKNQVVQVDMALIWTL